MEEAALKLVLNEWVGPRAMEERRGPSSRAGVEGQGVRWSSSLEPMKALSLVLFEML